MAHAVILILFLASFGISTTTKTTCDLYAAVGIRLTLPFVHEKYDHIEGLVWRHNGTTIYQQNQGKVSVGKQDDITSGGSLVLKNPKFSSAGLYQAQAFNASGALVRTWSIFVCIMEKVPKPVLSYKCDQKSVNIFCYTVKSQELHYSWKMDERTLAGETRSSLMIPLSKLKSKSMFTCGISNQVSNEKSDSVSPVCERQPDLSQNLCFPKMTVIAVVAGAMATDFILIIVIIALCCSRRKNKLLKRREKVEPTMLSLARREPETDYETMHHVPETFHEPSPMPSPSAQHRAIVNNPEAAGDALELPRPTEEQDHSPVPKPRTKRPNTPDP